MPDEKLSAAVQAFIARNLFSVEQLDILCLLFSRPGAEWTVEAVFNSVQTTLPSVETALAKFVAAGFIEKTTASPSTYRPRPGGEGKEVIPAVCEMYRQMPARVVQLIYQKERTALQNFADAFKIKKKP